jgi:hypothetical protein
MDNGKACCSPTCHACSRYERNHLGVRVSADQTGSFKLAIIELALQVPARWVGSIDCKITHKSQRVDGLDGQRRKIRRPGSRGKKEHML